MVIDSFMLALITRLFLLYIKRHGSLFEQNQAFVAIFISRRGFWK